MQATTRAAADRSSEQSGVVAPSDQVLGFAWLLRLRWGAVVIQLLAMACVTGLGTRLPLAPMLAVVLAMGASNAVLAQLGDDRLGWTLSVLLLDVVLLTAMLALSGGASNPFTVFFLVHVALGALLLRPRYAWLLAVATVMAFALLFGVPQQHGAGMHAGMTGHVGWSQHLVGMWVAYALAAAFVVHFVGKVSTALRQRERRLAVLEDIAAQNERLATLSSFSAHAAHELGTPLATMRLACSDLIEGLGMFDAGAAAPPAPTPDKAAAIAVADPSRWLRDAALIDEELRRCRRILSDLSARAGHCMGEMPVPTTPAQVIQTLQELGGAQVRHACEIAFSPPASAETAMVAPPRTLAQTLLNLVRNAWEAQPQGKLPGRVELAVSVDDALSFCVRDRGPGLPDSVRERFAQPFVSTKAGRGGLGLGLYLARAYAERVGGSLSYRDRQAGGTEVRLRLPRNAVTGT